MPPDAVDCMHARRLAEQRQALLPQVQVWQQFEIDSVALQRRWNEEARCCALLPGPWRAPSHQQGGCMRPSDLPACHLPTHLQQPERFIVHASHASCLKTDLARHV